MFCSKCGFQNDDDDMFCANCGNKLTTRAYTIVTQNTDTPATDTTPVAQSTIDTQASQPTQEIQQPTQPVQPATSFSGKAIAGFILSIAGFFIAGIICGVLGIIFSSLAFNDIKYKNQNGKGLAIAGLIIAIIVTVLSIFNIFYTIAMLPDLYYY